MAGIVIGMVVGPLTRVSAVAYRPLGLTHFLALCVFRLNKKFRYKLRLGIELNSQQYNDDIQR